jgi:hypothetical protein
MSAILGTFVKLGTMADGTPRLTLDLQCTLAEVAALGLMPGVPFGLARITNEASVVPILSNSTELEKPKGGALAKLAGMWCNDPDFWAFCDSTLEASSRGMNAEDAAGLVRRVCRIDSRAELDCDEQAADRFQKIFRLPYMAWKEGRNT